MINAEFAYRRGIVGIRIQNPENRGGYITTATIEESPAANPQLTLKAWQNPQQTTRAEKAGQEAKLQEHLARGKRIRVRPEVALPIPTRIETPRGG
jgi:hypothetical protein